MKSSTRIDSAGRVVIPKELRIRYGLKGGTVVNIVALPDGVSLIPERGQRRFVRRGPLLSIDMGVQEAAIEQFDVERIREERLDDADSMKPR